MGEVGLAGRTDIVYSGITDGDGGSSGDAAKPKSKKQGANVIYIFTFCYKNTQ